MLFFNFKRRETLMFDFYNICMSLYLEDSVQQRLCNHFLLYMLYTPAQINGIRFCEQQVYKLKFGLAQVTPPCYSTLRNSELLSFSYLFLTVFIELHLDSCIMLIAYKSKLQKI